MNYIAILRRSATTSFLVLLSVFSISAQSTKPAEENQTLQSLLIEVRQLRLTMERARLEAYRSQIILERIRTANQQVDRLTQNLARTREENEKFEQTIPSFEEREKLVAAEFQQETDVTRRARLELELKDHRRAIEQYKTLLSRGREREQQLVNEVRMNQMKLNELEGRLDLLEREIDSEIEQLGPERKRP